MSDSGQHSLLQYDYSDSSLIEVSVQRVGDAVLTFGLDTGRYEGELFVALQLWKIEKLDRLWARLESLRDGIAQSDDGSLHCNALYARLKDRCEVVVEMHLETAKLSLTCSVIREGIVDGPMCRAGLRSEVCSTPTAPHICHICKQPLRDAQGERYLIIGTTKSLAPCSSCGHKTSVYAVIHRCPHCSTMLESPTKQIGHRYDCPQCGWTAETPADELLRLDDAIRHDGSYFEINCPHCDAAAAALMADVGQRNVCRGCLLPFEIPQGGWQIEDVASNHGDPTMHCPNCEARLPVAVDRCPICQTRIGRAF